MSTFFLIRHGATDAMTRGVTGRAPGVHLNPSGERQALAVAEGLTAAGIGCIFSSPLERAHDTARPLARSLSLEVQVRQELTEVDFGDWTGLSFVELEKLSGWKQWNEFRSAGRIPGGETMAEVQSRMINIMRELTTRHPRETIALFSHGDPIRAAVMYWLGMPLDFVHRLHIAPASVTIIELDTRGVQVRNVGALVEPDFKSR